MEVLYLKVKSSWNIIMSNIKRFVKPHEITLIYWIYFDAIVNNRAENILLNIVNAKHIVFFICKYFISFVNIAEDL